MTDEKEKERKELIDKNLTIEISSKVVDVFGEYKLTIMEKVFILKFILDGVEMLDDITKKKAVQATLMEMSMKKLKEAGK